MTDFIQQLIDAAAKAAHNAHGSTASATAGAGLGLGVGAVGAHPHHQDHNHTSVHQDHHYAAAQHGRGFFNDANSSTGQSYSNGQGGIEKGVTADAGSSQVGVDGQTHHGLTSPMQILMIGSHAHHYAPPPMPAQSPAPQQSRGSMQPPPGDTPGNLPDIWDNHLSQSPMWQGDKAAAGFANNYADAFYGRGGLTDQLGSIIPPTSAYTGLASRELNDLGSLFGY